MKCLFVKNVFLHGTKVFVLTIFPSGVMESNNIRTNYLQNREMSVGRKVLCLVVWLLHNTKILQIHYRLAGYKNSALLIILFSCNYDRGRKGYRMGMLWVNA